MLTFSAIFWIHMTRATQQFVGNRVCYHDSASTADEPGHTIALELTDLTAYSLPIDAHLP